MDFWFCTNARAKKTWFYVPDSVEHCTRFAQKKPTTPLRAGRLLLAPQRSTQITWKSRAPSPGTCSSNPFVVIPAHDLDEGLVQRDTGFGVEHRSAGLATEVGGHHLVFGVAQHALHGTFRRRLHGSADFLVVGFLFQLDGQVHHRHVGGGHAEGHAGKLLVQLGNHHAHGLGGTGGAGDDVFQNAAAAAPVLVAWAVHGLLRGGGGVHGGHQAALDAPVVVQHLGHGGQAVGGARGVGDDGLASVLFMVHAEHEHGRVVLGGSGHQHLLGTGGQVLIGAGLVQEQAGGLNHDVGTDFVPPQVRGVTLLRQADLLAVHDQGVALDRDFALEAAVHAVVLEHKGQVVGLEQVVDAHDFDVREVLHRSAEHHAADAAEAVDANLDRHSSISPRLIAEISCVSRALYLRLSTACTVAATFSSVKPKCWNSTGAGADSP